MLPSHRSYGFLIEKAMKLPTFLLGVPRACASINATFGLRTPSALESPPSKFIDRPGVVFKRSILLVTSAHSARVNPGELSPRPAPRPIISRVRASLPPDSAGKLIADLLLGLFACTKYPGI